MIAGNFSFTYDEFQRAVKSHYSRSNPTKAQFDAIRNSYRTVGGITSKRELAMFIAQVMKESDGLRAKEEYCSRTARGCPHANNNGGAPGKKYHGRGYIQLTHAYNYKEASRAIYGDDRLLRNPELVATNEDVAWRTAFWFWKKNVRTKKGVQEGHFDVTTTWVNGRFSTSRNERFEIYKKVFKALNVPGQPKK